MQMGLCGDWPVCGWACMWMGLHVDGLVCGWACVEMGLHADGLVCGWVSWIDQFSLGPMGGIGDI